MYRRSKIFFAILLPLIAGWSCSSLRKPPLTWELLLEIDAPVSDRQTHLRPTIQVIIQRLNGYGVSGWAVQERGDRIQVRLPEVEDRERLKRFITTWGKLELVAVVSAPNPAVAQTYSSKEEAEASLGSQSVAPNRRILLYSQPEVNGPPVKKWIVAEMPAIITGSDLRSAAATPDLRGSSDYDIQFSLKQEGADRFSSWTGANINRYLAVVLNDQVMSVAFIRSQIFDQGVISGRFTRKNAEDLAVILKAGAFPAPVKIVEQ